jgi:hypothetical protein
VHEQFRCAGQEQRMCGLSRKLSARAAFASRAGCFARPPEGYAKWYHNMAPYQMERGLGIHSFSQSGAWNDAGFERVPCAVGPAGAGACLWRRGSRATVIRAVGAVGFPIIA